MTEPQAYTIKPLVWKADLHEQTGSGNAAPGPSCPNHAAPGATPVEVIVREREVGDVR